MSSPWRAPRSDRRCRALPLAIRSPLPTPRDVHSHPCCQDPYFAAVASLARHYHFRKVFLQLSYVGGIPRGMIFSLYRQAAGHTGFMISHEYFRLQVAKTDALLACDFSWWEEELGALLASIDKFQGAGISISQRSKT